MQLPGALKLPLKQQPQQQPQAADSADASTPVAAAVQQLDLDRLSADVPSRLLVSLLAAAAGDDVARPAAGVLASLDKAAAAKNDYLALFNCQQHFPQVRTSPYWAGVATQHTIETAGGLHRHLEAIKAGDPVWGCCCAA
jgi:hypothetical protein